MILTLSVLFLPLLTGLLALVTSGRGRQVTVLLGGLATFAVAMLLPSASGVEVPWFESLGIYFSVSPAGAGSVLVLVASLVMLVAGYLGEVRGMVDVDTMVWVWFAIGMAGWVYIIYEIFAGEASRISNTYGTVASKKAFNALRWIVTVGWAIYPIGYVLGYIGPDGNDNEGILNLVYNLADFVNKIAFGVVIWAAATSDEASNLPGARRSDGLESRDGADVVVVAE